MTGCIDSGNIDLKILMDLHIQNPSPVYKKVVQATLYGYK